jgi:CBS-domain-containing membrane protein
MKQHTTKKWMSRKIVSAHIQESLAAAQSKMDLNQIRHLIVEDDLGRTVGVLSDRDLLRAMHTDYTQRQWDEAPSGEFDPSLKVQDVMSWPAVCVPDTTPIQVIVQKMLSGKFSAMVIEKAGSAVPFGIITTTDLLALLNEMLESDSEVAVSLKTKPVSEVFYEN